MKKIVCLLSLLAVIGLMPSCHHAEHGHDHDHEHEHHHDAEQYTAYSDDFELFAEAEPFLVGQESQLAIHLTRLSNFKPLDSVAVRVSLIVDGKAVRQLVQHPDQPGIYRCSLTPSAAGCGQLRAEILFGDSTAVVEHPHVHVFASHDAMHGHHHDHASSATAVTFTKEQSWKVDFATAVLQPQPFGSIIKTSAQVLPSQGDEREAVATASGIVAFANANLVEGTQVKAGQQLFTIASNGMADNNIAVRMQEAAARYNAAKATYERKQQLAADRIVSQSDLEAARAEYETARAAYNNLKNNFSQHGAIVRAPISGYVQRINVSNGTYVEAGRSVVTISQNRDLLIRAEVQPRYYAQLAHIGDVNFLLSSGEAFSLSDLGGSLVSYGKATDADCPLVPVTFRVRNNGSLLSGSFVTAYISTASDREVLAVPNQGIVEEMGSFFVFVQLNPERFEKRLVTLGATDGCRTEITSGVQPGERVVTRGAAMVKLAQNSGALDPHAGHVH